MTCQPVRLGAVPQQFALALTEDADFVCTLLSQDGDWPVAAVIAIEVADQEWVATLAGPEARFNVDKADVATVIAASPTKFRLTYTEGDADLVWGAGPVVIYRA